MEFSRHIPACQIGFITRAIPMLLLSITAHSQDLPEVIVDINLDMVHEVDGISRLDRKKMITLHAPHTARDLIEEPEMFRYLVEDLDVSFGRDMGRINWDLNQVAEDPARPGYPSYLNMVYKGNQSKQWYAGLTEVHHLEEQSSLVVCPPVFPFMPGHSPTSPHPCCGGTSYTLANVSATAELFGNWLNLYHGGEGMPLPSWFEVINEPLWQMVTNNQIATIEEVFQYHNQLATGIRSLNSKVKIGGYATAIPNFYKDNFQQWDRRWKRFIDSAGANMDFYSLHFYDVYNNDGQKQFRKGSNLDATLDMIEHYSLLALDTIKPLVISEFCAQTNHMKETYWSPYRDWLQMKSISSMWLSFMERPNRIAKAVPFVVLKATWYNAEYPYQHRLMRKASEEDGETGDHWVFTEFIKVYELWADVRGRRIDTWSTDPDIQVDAYVEENRANVVLNNLEFTPRTIGLNLMGQDSRVVENMRIKHLYLKGDRPVLDTMEYPEAPATFTIAPEGTAVITYTFENPDNLDTPGISSETKYFADSYLQPIDSKTPAYFRISGVEKGNDGEGILRLGIGRDHGQSLQPAVLFNDSLLQVPSDFSGDAQSARERFFGVLEIPVPFHLIESENIISIDFPESGGHVSSVALQVFNATGEVSRSERPTEFSAQFRLSSAATRKPVPGALVVFSGDTTYSEESGEAFFDTIPEGTYTLQITAPHFEPYTQTGIVHNRNTKREINLIPVTYTVLFHISEAQLGVPVYNAMIESGGAVAYSNLSGEAQFGLANGIYGYRVSDPYFLEITDSICLTSDTTVNLQFQRLSADAKFVIRSGYDSTRLAGATVEIADTAKQTNALGLATFHRLKVDTLYSYAVTKQNLPPLFGSLLLRSDTTLHIHLFPTGYLNPGGRAGTRIFPVPSTTTLVIEARLRSSGPVGITITDIHGMIRMITRRDGIPGNNRFLISLLNLEPGIHFIHLEAEGIRTIHKIVISE